MLRSGWIPLCLQNLLCYDWVFCPLLHNYDQCEDLQGSSLRHSEWVGLSNTISKTAVQVYHDPDQINSWHGISTVDLDVHVVK